MSTDIRGYVYMLWQDYPWNPKEKYKLMSLDLEYYYHYHRVRH